MIDGASLDGRRVLSDRSWSVALERSSGDWKVAAASAEGLRKRHGLQGPIDDAFMGSFLMVRPTKRSMSDKFQEWSSREMEHAIVHWRRHFRGEARIKNDTEVDAADLASSNLVLWGDPTSNATLARISEQLPIRWSDTEIKAGERSFPADHHALILIYPNPLNPERYVVLNSGFTFREYDYLNNARQVPKLPDWAVVDLNTPPDARSPGKVVLADFFGEKWELKPEHSHE
jgi:hypothetical protein